MQVQFHFHTNIAQGPLGRMLVCWKPKVFNIKTCFVKNDTASWLLYSESYFIVNEFLIEIFKTDLSSVLVLE